KVDGHEHRADLRHGVERLELRVRVRRDVHDAIALPDAERVQRGRPAIAAVEEALVGEALLAVNDGLARRIEAPGAPRELQRGKWDFHAGGPEKVRPTL